MVNVSKCLKKLMLDVQLEANAQLANPRGGAFKHVKLEIFDKAI